MRTVIKLAIRDHDRKYMYVREASSGQFSKCECKQVLGKRLADSLMFWVGHENSASPSTAS